MDDEAKQLLREIRDLQREHLEIIRANVKQAEDVNRLVFENQTKWKQQTTRSMKLTVILFIVIFICFVALALIKRFHPTQ